MTSTSPPSFSDVGRQVSGISEYVRQPQRMYTWVALFLKCNCVNNGAALRETTFKDHRSDRAPTKAAAVPASRCWDFHIEAFRIGSLSQITLAIKPGRPLICPDPTGRAKSDG